MYFPKDIPPFLIGSVDPAALPDSMSFAGCKRLCEIIESVWAKVGHPEVKAWPEELPHRFAHVGKLYVVRSSGLVNGAPIARRS